MDDATRRLRIVSGHFFLPEQKPAQAGFDVSELQAVLEHDNLELRKQMKEFMKQDVYVP